jgi:hypothetical protein
MGCFELVDPSKNTPHPEFLRRHENIYESLLDSIRIRKPTIDLSLSGGKIANIMYSPIAPLRSRRLLPPSLRDGRELEFG